MKGLSQTLWIVIGIIVFLVVALVILTIFGQSIVGFSSIGQAENYCRTQAAVSCQATGSLPPTWNVANVQTPSGTQSCFELTGNAGTCSAVGASGGGGSVVQNCGDAGTNTQCVPAGSCNAQHQSSLPGCSGFEECCRL